MAQMQGRCLCPIQVEIADGHTEDELFMGPGGTRRLMLPTSEATTHKEQKYTSFPYPGAKESIKWK